MRYIIAVEGEQKVMDQFVTHGALFWEEDKKLPVVWNFHDNEAVGQATDLRREKDGTITAEVVLFRPQTEVTHDEDGTHVRITMFEEEIPEDFCISFQASPVEMHRWKDILWITSGQIRILAVVPYRFWPHR